MQVGLVDHSTCGEQLCDVALDWHPAFWKEPCLMRGKGWWKKGLTHLPQLQEPTLSCSNAALQKIELCWQHYQHRMILCC